MNSDNIPQLVSVNVPISVHHFTRLRWTIIMQLSKDLVNIMSFQERALQGESNCFRLLCGFLHALRPPCGASSPVTGTHTSFVLTPIIPLCRLL